MSRTCIRRTVAVLALLLLLLPGLAAARPLGPEPGGPAPLPNPLATFLSYLTGLLGAFLADGDTGMSIDPNGPPGTDAEADPDTGMLIDPHG